MAFLNCCTCGRTVSPDPPPIRLVDTLQPKARFALSSHSITPIEEPHNNNPMLEIRPPVPEVNGSQISSITSGHDVVPVQDKEDGFHRTYSNRRLHGIIGKVHKRSCDSIKTHQNLQKDTTAASGPKCPDADDTDEGIYRRHSSRKMHGVAGNIRKKLSRDSGISRRSSKRLLRDSLSLEHMNRRAELKRALHQRVKDSLQEDSTIDDTNYDEDAVPLKTPEGTWGRHEGTVHISPKYLREVLNRSDSPSRSLHEEHPQREPSEALSAINPAAALSRILTQRASHTVGDSGMQDTSGTARTPPKSQSRKKYVFEEDTPKAISRTRSPSPLDRSSTVLRSTPASKSLELGLIDPPLLHTLGRLHPPHLSPVQNSSINDSLADDQWRFSPMPKGNVLPATLERSNGPFKVGTTYAGIYDTRIRPASESWLHGASGMLAPSEHLKIRSGDHADNKMYHGHSCDPDSEELGFGGIDGKDDSPPVSIYHHARTRVRSEGIEQTAVAHIYNMHVPARLVSQPRLTSISYPQLLESSRKRSFSSGGSGGFHAQPRRRSSSSGIMSPSGQASSSGLPSPGIPMAWDNPCWRASSSVYSSQPSQPGSLLSSQQSSLRHVTTLQERLRHREVSSPNEEIISVPASKGKSIDLDKLERQSKDTDYHSSKESLMHRELAAANTRIVPLPRSKTLPTKSRFREELEQVSAEIALSNPFRRRVSNFDGNGEWSRASQAINDHQATSVWEKALREHSQEDAVLSHTRLGSNSAGPLDLETDQSSASTRDLPQHSILSSAHKHLSVDDWHGSSLQARLAAYKLPTPAQSHGKERVIKATKPSNSVSGTPSWTRYPSHTRSARAMSPAGELDQVYTRDFANMTPEPSPEPQDSEKGKRSLGFRKDILSSIKQIYRTQSQELQRRLANEARGHRSSVSEGGVLEYPELEMLSTSSPAMSSPDVNAKIEMEEAFRKAIKHKTFVINSNPYSKQHSSVEGATGWSKHYADCVEHPGKSAASSTALKVDRSASEGVGSTEYRMRNGDSGSGSSELRASTLDFKRSLEFHEGKAREKVLAMALGSAT